MVDVNSGRIVYSVGSFDKLKGGSDRLYPVPWPAARFSEDGKTFDLNVNADRLQTATSFPRGEWPNFNDEQFTTTTFRSYDQTPWWQENRARTVTLTADKDRPSVGNDARWSERPTSMQRMSELRGHEIRGADGKQIGQIGEVVFDPESGRILYAIESSGGRNVPIPWSALQAGDKSFQLNLTAEQWKKAPHFETERWPDVADQQWAEDIHRYYAVDPYWNAKPAPRNSDKP